MTLVGPWPSRRDSGGNLPVASVGGAGLCLCTSREGSADGECDSRDASKNSLSHAPPVRSCCGCKKGSGGPDPRPQLGAGAAIRPIKGSPHRLDPGDHVRSTRRIVVSEVAVLCVASARTEFRSQIRQMGAATARTAGVGRPAPTVGTQRDLAAGNGL